MYLPPGTLLLNRYRIEGVLGHGGFGITYLAQDLTLKVKVAVKEYLPRQLASRGEGRKRVMVFTGESRRHFNYGLKKFLEESQAVAQFAHHPNIVSVRDYFEANGSAYMVMEYVEGITFKAYLDRSGGHIAVALAIQIMMPVMDALREVHTAGLLHRDISPDNLYITTGGVVKILDFGAARYFAGGYRHSLSVILKTGYAPEEQYRTSGRQGAWTDVYGVAATLYRAITGIAPPDALDRKEADTLVPPSQLGVAISLGEEKTLLRGLAVQASQRFQSMMDFQDALTVGVTRVAASVFPGSLDPPRLLVSGPAEATSGSSPPSSGSVPQPVWTPSAGVRPPHRWLLQPALVAVLLTAVVLGLGGGLAWWHFWGDSSPSGHIPTAAKTGEEESPPAGKEAPLTSGPQTFPEDPSPRGGSTQPGAVPQGYAGRLPRELLDQGRALSTLGSFTEALSRLESAVRLDPTLVEAHYLIGRSYHQLGRPQEAIKALQQAIKLNYRFPEAHYNLGLAYLADDKKDLAMGTYKVLQGLDPEKATQLFAHIQQHQGGAAASGADKGAVISLYTGSPRWPWTSHQAVRESELGKMSPEDLVLMRTEIYARHGWVFRRQDLQGYFGRQPWYRPRGNPDKAMEINPSVLAGLNRIERQNAELIMKYEQRRKLRQ